MEPFGMTVECRTWCPTLSFTAWRTVWSLTTIIISPQCVRYYYSCTVRYCQVLLLSYDRLSGQRLPLRGSLQLHRLQEVDFLGVRHGHALPSCRRHHILQGASGSDREVFRTPNNKCKEKAKLWQTKFNTCLISPFPKARCWRWFSDLCRL